MNMAVELEQNTESSGFALEQNNFIDFLIADYTKQKENIMETMAALDTITASNRELLRQAGGSFPSQSKLLHLLNVQYWGQVYSRSNISMYLDANKRKKWSEDLHVHADNKAELPEFTYDNVLSTITAWYADREMMFADRVDHVFNSLSKTHITNEPQGFGKKMIFKYGCEDAGFITESLMTVTYNTRETLYDLACVLATILKQPMPERFQQAMFSKLRTGVKHDCFGGTFQIQVFKNSGVHVWIDPALAIDLNMWLAKKYPSAIPSEFRTKTTKIKEFDYRYDFLTAQDTEILKYLSDGYDLSVNMAYGRKYDQKAVERFAKFVGVESKELYNLGRHHQYVSVARMVMRSGYPNIKDHQYYPTPNSIVDTIKDYLGCGVDSDLIKVLEPSAGSGKLAEIFQAKDVVECVEVSPFFCNILQNKGFKNVHNQDFIKFKTENRYDLIVMNPPYAKKQLEDHLSKALTLLADDGELILVAPKGKLNAIAEIAKSYNVEVLATHQGEFEDTKIETSIYVISPQ